MSGVSNYEPYAPNAEGLTQVLLDLKDTMAGKTVYAVAGFGALAFENVTQGAALYSRSSDGKVGLARAAGTLDEATVVGFAQTAKNTGEEVRVLTVGVLATSGLDEGDPFYLATGYGGITSTPPSTAGQYLVRVGEASTTANLIIQLEPPILLS
jgi:hypothetical protein